MKNSRTVYIKDIPIGGDNPVIVQSMCTGRVEDTERLISEIETLHNCGADIVRFAVRNMKEARLVRRVVDKTSAALVADIHFDYRLAVESIKNGVHKVRINPGNIGSMQKTEEVVRAAKDHAVPIRIGVNGGSLDRAKYPETTPRAMVDSAAEHIHILEKLDFYDTVISLKSSDPRITVESNRLMAKTYDYPLHLGLTEAGFGLSGIIKSSVALGTLLLEGIGGTIRVSLTGDPREEIDAAYRILAAAGRKGYGIDIIACPTCGRTDRAVDLRDTAARAEKLLAKHFEERLHKAGATVTVAVMGCEVNGPGEASHADAGLAGAGNGSSFQLFSKGRIIRKVSGEDAVNALVNEVDRILTERGV